jgi:D-alanyl-D-alanine carboxypeptidase (penicillin-binding protein 5/6)
VRRRLAGICIALGLMVSAPASAATTLPSSPPEVADIPVALLVDTGSGRILYARRSDLRFVPASVAKVMSVYTSFAMIARGKLREDQVMRISAATAREWNGKGTSLYLQEDEAVPVAMLIRGITTVSANDAAVALAIGHSGSVGGWTALMNTEARRLGMADSRFSTPNGWPDNGATYVSAHDLVLLGTDLIERFPRQYRTYFGQKSLTRHGVSQFNRDPMLGEVAGADGIKTGHTREAGYTYLGSAMRGGRRLMMVIAGAKSEAERSLAARALMEWGFSAWERRQIFSKGAVVGSVRVQQGNARSVRLIAPRAISVTLPRASPDFNRTRLVIRYKGPLIAPIRRGQEVARLIIRTADGGTSAVPLVAAEAVGTAGPLDRLVNGLYGLLP